MQDRELSFPSVEALHAFVHQTLCASENLLEDQFRTRQLPLFSNGQLCAVEYSLAGPRAIRLGAIWAVDPNVLYFYDASGERTNKIRLTSRPPVDALVQENKVA